MYRETGILQDAATPAQGIPREALIKKMKAISAKKNIYMVAPGGYGKSVAAAQWLGSVRGKTERMIARETDNNPEVFYSRLAKALERFVTIKESKMPQPVDSFERLLAFFELLPKKSPRCYFALDDLHMVRNEEILSALPIIASRLPNTICLLLASRSEPAPKLIATGLFEVVAKEDLLFSPGEVEWLGAEKDRELNQEQIDKLLEITGGWAMYLSAILSASASPDSRRLGKVPQTLTQYLESRVWSRWDDETKALLLRLSIPGKITPALCERLTGEPDGRGVLEHLTKKENAFLIQESAGLYRFHDVFHDFLTNHINSVLSEEEVRWLHDAAAACFYQQGNYFEGAWHYIINGDYDGIKRCMEATNIYTGKTSDMSVLSRLHFFKQYVLILTPAFISKSPYLLAKCIAATFYDGDTKTYLRYTDIFYAMEQDIITNHPKHLENYLFVTTFDFRMSLKQHVERVHKMMLLRGVGKGAPAEKTKEAKATTITQNLPYFHRSMRDFSEYYELKEEELATLKATFGTMIGKDYAVMEPVIRAGIYYERGELLEAVRHASTAYSLCRDDMHPETIFSSYVIFSAVLYAMGALRESADVMARAGRHIEEKALFLRRNFLALTFERAIRDGEPDAAHVWLLFHANHSARPPFYQICRHFTTLRAHIAVKDFAEAIAFGARLLALVTAYKRPTDQIETGLLMAIALWKNGENDKAVKQLEQAMRIALPYGFTQLFLNEGREVLPLLWAFGKGLEQSADLSQFAGRLAEDICKKHNLSPTEAQPPKLSGQQTAMLSYLSKGMTRNEIAVAAGLAPGTVKVHLKMLYKKLGVHDAADAVAKAKMLGLMEK